MKKIFSKYFVVAVVAVAMGCISSCKDFDDEMYMSLRGEDVGLENKFATNLKDSIAKLRTEMKDSLSVARQERQEIQDSLDRYILKAEKLYATKEELADTAEVLRELLAKEIEETVDSITVVADSVGRVAGRVKVLEENYEKLDEIYATIESVEDTLESYYTMAEVDELISDENLEKALKRILKKKDDGETPGEGEDPLDVRGMIQQIVYEMFRNSESGDEESPFDLSDLTNKAETAYDKALANETAIQTMQGLINQIKQCNCPVLVERVEVLENKMDSIEKVCKDLEYNFNVLESRVDTLSGIEETKALAQQAQNKAEQYAKEYTDAALDAVLDYVNPRFTSIEEMLAEFYTQIENHADQLLAHDASIAALKDSVELLRSDLTSLEKRIKKNEEAIEDLTERMEIVEGALQNRISSVVLQATKSPVVGYFNIPMGVKSNVLAAYYGEAMNDVYFPTIRTANLISGEPLTEAEAALLNLKDEVLYGQGEVLIDDTEGNAGTLYVTINPAEVDLTGVYFNLVNSLDEVSYVTLGSFEESKEKLTFGYTRAANGFYEAKATITAKDAANAKIRVEYDDVKELASELKNSVENLNVNFTGIATSLQSIVNDVADATAVKAYWKDDMGDHNVYSEYALAAMTVKPLSFQFMQNFEMKNFPGITRVSNFINNAIDKINIALPTFDMDFTAPEIKKIQIKDFDELGVNCIIETTVQYELNMTVPVDDVVIGEQTVVVPGQTISVPVAEQKGYGEINGEKVEVIVPATTVDVIVNGTTVKVDEQVITINDVVVNKTLEIPVKYDMTDIIKDLYGNVTEPIEDVNAMLGDLEDFMDDVNKMLEQLDAINDIEQSITDAKNDIKKELNGYLERLNNKLCGAINSVHDRLQPNMLLKTEDGFAMLSQVKNMPTELDAANCVLVPTTYTGELLVPAFKKYVAVVNVKDAEGNDVTSAEIANVNTGKLNTVLAGSTTEIEFAGKSGYTYELVYSALDYSGKYSNVRYYVTVK